jgi:bifunctional UDP-N-acetylglucosamine pyrophosphorylase / glucosamine-1-phosphate N-acetyltransferase
MSLHIIILAAGKGQRMLSETPKVLHLLGGKPMLQHVIEVAQQLNPDTIHVVHSNGMANLPDIFAHLSVHWVEQKELFGTGHAVSHALPYCTDEDHVLILYGDVPLITKDSLQLLIEKTPASGLGLIVSELTDPTGFGRIIRNVQGQVTAIVEHRDASPTQLAIREVNTGITLTMAGHLKKWLPQLKNSNQQCEYYFTDIFELAAKSGMIIDTVQAINREETMGVNDRAELAYLERCYQFQEARALMQAGVTIADPRRLDIRGSVTIAADVFLDINVILEGHVVIGKNSRIGPNVFLKNVEIGEGVEILANCFIEGAVIDDLCQIGPFARIRPDTVIESGVKLGNFVEVKKTFIGKDSKAHHFGYLGDSIIGSHVNIGAGTITCNYDGKNKYQTEIAEGAFIGAHSTLVAPLTIGKNATIGAGSVITHDAAEDTLTVARARQTSIKGWRRGTKKKPENAS